VITYSVPGTTFIVIMMVRRQNAVKQVLRRFADPSNRYVAKPHTRSSVSFIQIGDDAGATRF
jgi:hypothetical protein